MIIYNALTARGRVFQGEKYTLPSKTIPNMTLSLKELLQRYTRGEMLPANPQMIFTGDDEILDTRGMSEMDIIDLKREVSAEITKLTLEIDAKNKAKVTAKKDVPAEGDPKPAEDTPQNTETVPPSSK